MVNNNNRDANTNHVKTKIILMIEQKTVVHSNHRMSLSMSKRVMCKNSKIIRKEKNNMLVW